MSIQRTVTYERKPLKPFVSKHEIVAIGVYVSGEKIIIRYSSERDWLNLLVMIGLVNVIKLAVIQTGFIELAIPATTKYDILNYYFFLFFFQFLFTLTDFNRNELKHAKEFYMMYHVVPCTKVSIHFFNGDSLFRQRSYHCQRGRFFL